MLQNISFFYSSNMKATTGNIQRSNFPFVKCNLNLSCMFDPNEIIFIMHMLHISYIRSKGYNTVWSKKHLMLRTNIRLRTFDRCVKRMTELKLLERMPQDGMYDYLWNISIYNRLLTILCATTDINSLIAFCQLNFNVQKRKIQSITDEEIFLLRG